MWLQHHPRHACHTGVTRACYKHLTCVSVKVLGDLYRGTSYTIRKQKATNYNVHIKVLYVHVCFCPSWYRKNPLQKLYDWGIIQNTQTNISLYTLMHELAIISLIAIASFIWSTFHEFSPTQQSTHPLSEGKSLLAACLKASQSNLLLLWSKSTQWPKYLSSIPIYLAIYCSM